MACLHLMSAPDIRVLSAINDLLSNSSTKKLSISQGTPTQGLGQLGINFSVSLILNEFENKNSSQNELISDDFGFRTVLEHSSFNVVVSMQGL